MDRSLLVLSKLRVKGALRKLKRTLLTPKGIVPALFLLAFMAMAIVPIVAARFAPPEMRERLNFNRFLHPAALAGLWLLTLAGGRMKSPISFTLPEVDFLFPGPYTRRQLLVYKLSLDALGALGFVLLLPLFVGAYLNVWWPAALLGFWLTLTFVQMVSVIVALGIDLAGARLGRWLIAILPLVVAAAGLSLWQSGMFEAGLDWQQRLAALDGSWIARILLAPFVALHNAILASSLAEAALWSTAAVALNGMAMAAILSLDANFLEASLAASQRRYELLERMKRGGVPAIGMRSRPRLRLPMPPRLAGAGPMAWRQTLHLVRGSGRLLFILPAMIGPVIGAIAAGRNPHAQQAGAFAGIGMVFFLGFMVTTIMPLGMRGDIQHAESLKSLPLSGSAIAWGSTLSATLYTLFIQLVATLAMALAMGRSGALLPLALAFAVPVNLLLVASDGALVVLFPSTAQMTTGDPMAGVRMMLVYLAKTLYCCAMAGIAALVVLVVYLAVGDVRIVLYGVGWLVATVEGLATVWLMGKLFESFDPSTGE